MKLETGSLPFALCAGYERMALCAGYERMAAWADLLDQINVFPVADDDTGRNLRISLAPLRHREPDRLRIVDRLLTSATGNSGNIAAGFFAGFLESDPAHELAAAAHLGSRRAWAALGDPRPGTMLTAFDALAAACAEPAESGAAQTPERLVAALREAVLSTADTLPAMKRAGVVDAGALGMYLFFEGFLAQAAHASHRFSSPMEIFGGRLKIADRFAADPSPGYCVDTIVAPGDGGLAGAGAIDDIGESLVVLQSKEGVKIHLHTDRREEVRRRLESFGRVLRWSDEAIDEVPDRNEDRLKAGPVHVVTDAAGSVTRREAKRLGMTLLDSYLVFEDRTVPETLLPAEALYASMRAGRKVTTAQASDFERRQRYESLLSRHRRVLYLSVGSVYTGNYHTASDWQRNHDPENRFAVIDTGSASGRLAVAAAAVARFAAEATKARSILDYAEWAVNQSREYLFLDRLKYLAAGGRLSRTRGFFGDLLGKKPVISPTADGAVRAGIVRDKEEQIAFALERIETEFGPEKKGTILLQHSDNQRWVTETVQPAVAAVFGRARIRVGPLSLTSGAHMGPGTWGVAFLPAPDSRAEADAGDGR